MQIGFGEIFLLTMFLWAIAVFVQETKKRQNRELHKNDPQALVRLEEIENERRQLRNAVINGGLKTGVGITAMIIKALTKK